MPVRPSAGVRRVDPRLARHSELAPAMRMERASVLIRPRSAGRVRSHRFSLC